MEIPTMLLERVLLDVRLQFIDTIDRDLAVMRDRYEKEGMSFLTITLPLLDDALLQGLSSGRLSRSNFVGFRPFKRGGSLPALLQGFFRRIFHDDGSIRAEPDVCAIQAIRQVTRLFKKVELTCSKPRIKAAYERYISNDREVDWRRHRYPFDVSVFRSICGYLWSDLEELSGELYCFPGIFGPGATSERYSRNERHTITQWPERSEGSFPSSFYASHQESSGPLHGVHYLTGAEELPVRVVQVPKTLKTPRTISVEPSHMMLMQQSIAKPLMAYLESKRFGFQSIRFTDQKVNRILARKGSLDGSLATIDLKDASDLVDLDLVREIFRGPCPSFLHLIEDCRSTKALLPDGSHLPLRKFASMGSAMCFPVEAMTFFTIIMYALVKESGKVPSRCLLQKLAKDVAVYGDDIIVRSSMAPVVIEKLEDFGLRVNHDKSFLTGLFRESCGGDYYNGVDVTPAYVRQWDETGTLSTKSLLVAYVSLSNTFYMKGLWHACQSTRDFVASRTRISIPLARHPIGVLHYSSFVRDTSVSWDSKLSSFRVRGHRVRVPKQDDSPSNISGFLGLCFGSRYFRDRLTVFRKTVCAGRPVSNDPRYETTEAPALHREGATYGLGITYADSASRLDGQREHFNVQSYADMSRTGTYSIHEKLLHARGITGGRNLFHLETKQGTSLYTSDKPHALCLKRGWTASQAGLSW